MPDPVVSVVIPAFNEEQRIGRTLQRVGAELDARGEPYEVVVVDDGSTDRTLLTCRDLARTMPCLRILTSAQNRGKGHAVRIGMLASRGAERVLYDADGATPITELPKLLAPLRAREAAVVIGSRYIGGAAPHRQPLWRRVWSRLVNAWVQAALVPGVRDTQCGFKAFTSVVATDLFGRSTADGWAFDVEVLALAYRAGYPVREVAVDWHDDRRSRVRPWRDLAGVLTETWAIRQRLEASPGCRA
jgi:glycosyltransferase involved in cell wall biosynthesis